MNLTKAVETIVGLLDHRGERIRRLVCKDIIECILKNKEIDDLEERITPIL